MLNWLYNLLLKKRFIYIFIIFFIIYLILFFNYKIFPYKILVYLKINYTDPIKIYISNNKDLSKCLYKNKFSPVLKINNEKYNFFIAGHVYGKPYTKKKGIYEKFYKKILNKKKYDFGIFAGDIVFTPNDNSWNVIDKQLSKIKYKIFFAAGNHEYNDKETKKIYEKRYGKTFYNFKFKKDLFIVLDSNLNNQNIIGQQLKFFNKSIKENKFNNLYIVSHHLIWMHNQNIFKSNNKIFDLSSSNKSYPKDFKTNFWDEISTELLKLKNNVYFISGDLGAFPWVKSFYCKQYKNIKFLATGMGSGKNDNYISFEILNNKNPKIKINFFK